MQHCLDKGSKGGKTRNTKAATAAAKEACKNANGALCADIIASL